ncbi:alpha/beta fold hydrolase BchO [Dichotomicrobium thermohalophilum]|uniref:Magnesium chelatase accessory protein n=1 Tax=Dichotomicrobium thermohalophilum TaxID=933063 RepID=A0A397Q6Y9_9HYPH|nr:alpha/beta fold hydrolase BchO [Dichotomicrobium thermohalophilum]RIA56733.1 magnesium chelatase accessory protein [Dichotomicrobium thermohalophilum]
MSDGLDWKKDGADWPNRNCSGFVEAGGLTWHVQRMGQGPVILLIHGTGASTHSWRDLAPRLAQRFTVIAPDLPGHAFTDRPASRELSLTNMGHLVCKLVEALDVEPALVVGHSAGAAIALRMVLDNCITPAAIVSLNGALFPFSGVARHVFPPVARLMLLNPFTPRIFTAQAKSPQRVERLIENTGSRIDDRGLSLYKRLFREPGHVLGALGMMANWDLKPLQDAMDKITTPVVLVATEDDRAIPPSNSMRARDKLPNARVVYLRGLGHLAHEEAPEQIGEIIDEAARENGVL